MSRDAYLVVKPAFYAGVVLVGLVLWYFIARRHASRPLADRISLIIPTLVATFSALFPFWMVYVQNHVPIRDEGMQLGIEFVFFLGPAALVACGISIFGGSLRRLALCLSLVYVPAAGVLFLTAQ